MKYPQLSWHFVAPLAALFTLLQLLVCCSSRPTHEKPTYASDQHRVRHLEFWKQYSEKARSFENLVQEAPPELIDYLCKDNIVQGFPNIPTQYKLTPDYQKDFRDALGELPKVVKRKLHTRLFGVFVVNDLGGSAYTDSVLDDKNHPIGAFVVLDASVMNRQANEWITWKENSPFLETAAIQLSAQIEESPGNSRKNALQFILLHEFGHVLGITAGLHPSWSEITGKRTPPENYPFSALSWTLTNQGKYASIFDKEFKDRNLVQYYRESKSKLSATIAHDLYTALEKTNFPTLYGITNPFDDFAESFATYVHGVLLRKPYRIEIKKDGKVEKTYSSCWDDTRCKKKRSVIEKLLND